MKTLLLAVAVLGLCACEAKPTGPDPKETERLTAYYLDHFQEMLAKARECKPLSPEQYNQRADCLAVRKASQEGRMKNYATGGRPEAEPAKPAN